MARKTKTMTFDEFVQRIDANDPVEKGGRRMVKAVRCADGFSVSIQASVFHYCTPRATVPYSQYSAYELGYPSEGDDLIEEYAETPDRPPRSIYAWVPREVVAQLVEKHGGIVK